MLTDERKAMMLARFDIFKSPVPRMDAIEKTSETVRAYWGEGVPLSESQMRELWFKLQRERKNALLAICELGFVWRVLFTQIEEGLPPLYDVPDVVSHVVETFLKKDLKGKAEGFLKKYFIYFPDPGRAPQDVYSSMTKLAEFTPDTSFLAEFGLTGINGPVKAAEMLRSDETIQLGIERMTGGLIAGKSRFSELVWKSRFTQYRKMIGEAAFGTYEDLMQALGVVSADSLDKNSRLRDGTELYRFTKAVLGDFLDDQEKVPEAFARREIIQFFEGFLGARKDPNNASRWKPIADIVAPIFDFWELGLKLENIFEFAREAVERDPSASSRSLAYSSTAMRHWTERREFWLRYWRAGRFLNVRVYATAESRRREFTAAFRKKYPDVVRDLGMIYGHSSSTLMFLFELRGNVVISEFSNQGAIRIGHANNQVSPKFQKIFWDDLRDDLRVSISHLGHWKQKTDDAISRMTMERVPR